MSTPSLEDDEVTFLGFGSYEWEPTADYSLLTISETPPETLLECDDCIMSELEDNSAQEQLRKGKKIGRKKTKDRGRLFRQQHLQSLLAEQKPTPSMPGHANYVSSQSQACQSDRWPAVAVETDQELTVEGIHDQGLNSESASDQGSVSGHGSGQQSNDSSGSDHSGNDPGSADGSGSGGDGSGQEPDPAVINLISPNGKQRILRVRRSLVLQDLLKEFLEDSIMTCELKIIMVDGQGRDERGEDIRGIYRDALASFWQEFYISFSLGERGRVPFLRHDFQSEQWTAVGRIIVKGHQDLGYFPVMLSKAFVICAMFGEKAVSEDTLLESFNEYLAPSEEQVVREALQRTDEEWNLDDTADEDQKDEELLDLLERFGCRKFPTKENIMSLILEVAHKEIIQKPQYVADCWDGVFKEALTKGNLSTLEGVCSVYQSLEPTTKKVLGMLHAAPKTNAEGSALDYFKRFIRGLDIHQLKCLLMFITGADVICVTKLEINFTKLEGLARRPIAHVCGCVLELPSTYDSYTEFRSEFTNVLAKEKWQNDIM